MLKMQAENTLARTLGIGSFATSIFILWGVVSDPVNVTKHFLLGAVAISIPILSGRAKKMEEAVKTYNDGLKDSGSTDFDLNALANQNGIGIQIKF
jgi:hypothetical protein